jgi:type IV secretion system protein VirB10
MPLRRAFLGLVVAVGGVFAQEPPAPATQPASAGPAPSWRKAEEAKTPEAKLAEAKAGDFVVDAGTKVPLTLINSISTKHSAEGDRVYLQTVYPIMVSGRIVIPPGSYVAGTVTVVKRPGRVKGRGELFLRFDSLTLPNGVTRDFRARIGTMDGRASEEFDRAEGKIKSEGNKGGDARTVGESAAAGASVGVLAGAAAGHYGMGAGIGAAAGAAAGLMGVLLTRGPDAVLAKGSTIEMILDRPLHFQDTELMSGPMQPVQVSDGGPQPEKKTSGVLPTRRFPF